MAGNIVAITQPSSAGLVRGRLNDPQTLDRLIVYKKRIAGNYRPLPSNEINKLPPGNMLVSEKIDGELWFLCKVSSDIFLANQHGSVIAGDLPIFNTLKNSELDDCIIAGELHARRQKNRPRVGDLASVLSSDELDQLVKLKFTAFDLVHSKNNEVPQKYENRYNWLNDNLIPNEAFSLIEHTSVSTAKEIQDLYNNQVASGNYEGLVIRLESGLIYKLKPTITIDSVIVAFTIKSDEPEMARSILLGQRHADGLFQIFGGCGNLGDNENRRKLYKELSSIKINSNIRYASDSGALYNFVEPKIITEIRVNDLQAEKSDGEVSLTSLIRFEDGAWSGVGMAPCPRPIHPVLERIRTDKTIDYNDIKFDQIAPYLQSFKEINEQDATQLRSKILRREVWTKEAKGVVSVRKLLLWKTNKNEVNNLFPAYVIHWTDYSSTRASPLEREVKTAPTEKLAQEIAESLIEDNIKKGWVKLA